MRNVFDQYSSPENRLTHSLASALYQDPALLKTFMAKFGPSASPAIKSLRLIEQSLPGKIEPAEEDGESQGLPDALIYSNGGWALVIESKVSSPLRGEQLNRHFATVRRCGFQDIYGLAITVRPPALVLKNWSTTTWREIYAWANELKDTSLWAKLMVEYFNVAEQRMISERYLKEGTITEYAGISFDPYTYLEGKRVLRLLSQKLRENKDFIGMMGLDGTSARPAITEQEMLWDFISFTQKGAVVAASKKSPHCTVGINAVHAEAMITFPNGMSPTLRKRLHGGSFVDFVGRLQQATGDISAALGGLRAYRPIARVMQRRYPSQRSVPLMDARMTLDLRTLSGDPQPGFGPAIKSQPEWARAAYELLLNRRSNIQFQIGVEFSYTQFGELADRNSDRHFEAAFRALRPFAGSVLD